MGRYVITGGTSGIGLEVGRKLVASGHDVVLLGRDPTKCSAAVESLGPSKTTAYAVDLSTHAGVRSAVSVLGDGPIDGLVHSAGVVTLKDVRTEDGLHPVFSVNYLSRYHVTQLVMPKLKAAKAPTVVLIVTNVPRDTKVDFDLFPRFQPFPGIGALPQTQIALFHFGAWLARREPKLRVALTNIGLVNTDIMREMPFAMRVGYALLTPIVGVSKRRAASMPAHLSISEGWRSGEYWPTPGRYVSEKLILDAATGERLAAINRELTGV